jgi:phospholipid/cholesterol/gamma-HCH transport system substrate-binding protein
MIKRRTIAAVLVLAGVVAGSGCSQWRGLNSLPMPGTQGRGPGSFHIQVQMPDVNNLEPNSRVRVADVSVGTVTRIDRQDWHALLTITLDGDVDLPANATAKLGQTSLLGSQHLELGPPTAGPPRGRLTEGSVIPLANSGFYPTTEETLAAVSSSSTAAGSVRSRTSRRRSARRFAVANKTCAVSPGSSTPSQRISTI